MTAVVLALTASLLWGFGDYIGGRASREHPQVLLVASNVAIGAVMMSIVIASRGDGLPDHNALVYGALAGIIGLAAWILIYRALAHGPLSVMLPIFALGAGIPALFGVLRGDDLSALQGIGLVCALAGAVLAAREPAHVGDRTERIGLVYVTGATVALGVTLIVIDAGGNSDAVGTVFAMRTSATLTLLPVLFYQRPSRATIRAVFPFGLAVGTIDTTANTSFSLATSSGLLSEVAVLGSLFPIVSVALARFHLGERIARVQELGVALAIVGTLAIAGG